MLYSDPIGDLLARIRNAHASKKEVVRSPASKLRMDILSVLQKEGYIEGYICEDVRPGVKDLLITLKYFDSKPVIQLIRRVSKPGHRIYCRVGQLPRFYNGMGVSVLSTSKGVMSDADAKERGVGGEILCQVY